MNIQAEWPDLEKNVPWVESPDFEKIVATKNLSISDRKIAEDLHYKGFAILEGILENDLIDRIVDDTDLLFDPNIPDGPRCRNRCMDAWKESAAVRNLALHPEILRILKLLYDREPFPFQTLNFLYGSEQKTHSDTIHFNSLPVRFMCGTWVALEDATEENGPLHYYEGSNRIQDYDLFDLGLSGDAASYIGYENAVTQLMKQKEFKRKTFTIKKGTVGIWAANLFHGGTPILSPGLTRKSQVTHYFFNDCLYYSPMYSNRRAGELFLNDFDIKLNIRTMKTIRPNLNGQSIAFEPIGGGKFRIVSESQKSIQPLKNVLSKRARQFKARCGVPYRRMKMKWLHLIKT